MARISFTRHIPIEDDYDLCVLGGGPAGSMAAIAAGRLGAKVLLIENTGCLGGMGTSGLVTAFDPMADGERTLVGGIMREVVSTLYQEGELGPNVTPEVFTTRYMAWTPFKVEGYKRVLDRFTNAAGVEIRFFTRLCDVDADPGTGHVRGVILNNIEGWRYIRARTFIDCTGDAVLAAGAGAACREAGRDTPQIMPATLPSLFAGIAWKDYDRKVAMDALRKAIADGFFTQPDLHMGLSRIGVSTGYLNGGHLFNLNALRCKDLSDGAMLGRRIAKEYFDFLRRFAPGCEQIEHVTTASLLGIRESRRIVGEYELTIQDYLARRKFPDQIGLYNKFIDIHPYDCSPAERERFEKESNDPRLRLASGESFGLPYGILVPRGWKNLWVAGRCASSDVQVHGSIRVQPAAAMMGQAAGTAAVQMIRHGGDAGTLDTARLIETLRVHGAYLPQIQLTRVLTRS